MAYDTNYDFKVRDELEDIILGTIISHDSESRMKPLLMKHGIDDPIYFRSKFNQDVFATILKCWEQDLPADLVTVINLRPSDYREEGSFKPTNMFDANIISMISRVGSSAHFEHHLWIFKQYLVMDYWNDKASDILMNYWDNRDSIQVADNIVQGYNLLIEKFTKGMKEVNNANVKEKAKEKYEKAISGNVVSVPTGLLSYDSFSGGWQSPELSIIAARPSVGKTTVSLAVAKNSSFYFKRKGLFISLEMTKQQLMNKIISSETGLDYQDIKNYKLSKEDFDKVLWWYDYFETESYLKVIDGSEARTISEIENAIKAIKPDFVMIDYLQLIKMDRKMKQGANREQEVSEISRTLKLFCTEYDIPIIALSQLSRSVDSRPNKRPILSDLRESGAIEQDADNVIFLYREAYYKEQKDGVNANIPQIEKGNFEWIVAKGRETGTGSFMNNIDFKTFKLSDGFLYNNAPPPP